MNVLLRLLVSAAGDSKVDRIGNKSLAIRKLGRTQSLCQAKTVKNIFDSHAKTSFLLLAAHISCRLKMIS